MHYWHGNGKLSMLNVDEIDVAYSIISNMLINVGVRRKNHGRVYYYKPEFRDRSDYLLFEPQSELKAAWDKLIKHSSKRQRDEPALEAALDDFNGLLYKYMEEDGWREVRKQIARKRVKLTKKTIEISAETYAILTKKVSQYNKANDESLTLDNYLIKLISEQAKN
ncbi:hypothetical protein [Motilimonas eburnea]|uniref:hypothetical protein n=1 Tax=Motilimonas eburnea TaxID=1737488 RepID=UPI001E2F7DB6|nr:hypothetical protein [Motilimonas eburnea]MCE2571796.1 hypothetical protein [Motilimonas eburnea]